LGRSIYLWEFNVREGSIGDVVGIVAAFLMVVVILTSNILNGVVAGLAVAVILIAVAMRARSIWRQHRA
jgi:MFS superfamily sulfate permease-like transporter